jgi:anti-sigma factor RsiW
MNMRDEHYQKIMETSWRRKLNSEEEAALEKFLAAHPEAQKTWAEDAALNRILQRWPVPPLSSNFTARLLLTVQTAPGRRSWIHWFAPAEWLPEGRAARLAMCSMMVCVGLFSFHESEVVHRAKIARELAGVSRVATLPRMEWLKDFDTIKGISQTKVADDDLLAALE